MTIRIISTNRCCKHHTTKDAVNNIVSYSPSEYVESFQFTLNITLHFLVDTSALIVWRDIRTELVGGLARSGTKIFYFDIENENHAINTSEDNVTHVEKRRTYKHKSYPNFHKIVISLSESRSCFPSNLYYVQYYFEEGEKDISFSYTHGNSKGDKLFKATKYSVRKEIKSLASKRKKGKEIIQCLTQSAEGFSKAKTVAELPNWLNQIYDLSRKNKIKDTQNELLELIDMCNMQYGLPNAFLREFVRLRS